MDQGDELTRSGAILGTPSYLSPEQAAGDRHAITTAVDVYGLGAILYYLLTGAPPVTGASTFEILEAVRNEEPVPPRRRNVLVDIDLETICLRCLEKSPLQRYPTALSLAEDLERWLAGKPIHARRTGALERTQKWVRRRPSLAAAIGVAILGVVLGFGATAWQWRRADAERRRAEAELGHSRRQIYLNRVAAADLALRVGDRVLAERLLDDTEPAARKWEWHHLRAEALSDHETFFVPGDVVAVAFDPDGARLHAITEEGALYTFDPSTGERLASFVLEGHTGILARRFDFSPDRTLVATWLTPYNGGDRIVRLFSTKTGRLIRQLPQAADEIGWVRFSPDGTRIWIGPPTVRGWDPNENPTGYVLDVATGLPSSVAGGKKDWADTAPLRLADKKLDGQLRLSWTRGEYLEVTRCDTGQVLHPVEHNKGVNTSTIDPRGERLVTGGENVKLYHLEPKPEIRLLHAGPIAAGAGPDGESEQRDLAFSPDGSRLVSLPGAGPFGWSSLEIEGQGEIWDTSSGRLVARLAIPDPGGAVNSESSTFAPACNMGPLTSSLVSFSADGRFIAGPTRGAKVGIWDARDGHLLRRLAPSAAEHPPWLGLTFLVDGTLLVAVAEGQDSLGTIWDAEKGTLLRSFRLRDSWENGQKTPYTGFAVAPDGHRAITTYSPRIWEPLTGDSLGTPLGLVPPSFAPALSPDGRWLASLVRDKAYVVELATAIGWSRSPLPENGADPIQLSNHGVTMRRIVFSPDGSRLATADDNGTVGIWDPATGEPTLSLRGHEGRVESLAFSRDGTWLASADQKGNIRLWDGRPRPVATFLAERPSPAVRVSWFALNLIDVVNLVGWIIGTLLIAASLSLRARGGRILIKLKRTWAAPVLTAIGFGFYFWMVVRLGGLGVLGFWSLLPPNGLREHGVCSHFTLDPWSRIRWWGWERMRPAWSILVLVYDVETVRGLRRRRRRVLVREEQRAAVEAIFRERARVSLV